MDFSFRTGFRERSSMASLLQTGGRVNRGSRHENAEVWDILLRDDRFSANPALEIARRSLGSFAESKINALPPGELATEAFRRELTCGGRQCAADIIAEMQMEYPTVAAKCQVIPTETRTVLVGADVADRLRNGSKVASLEILRKSVELWARKIQELGIEPVFTHCERGDEPTLYVWPHDYDPDLLGYMAGVFRLQPFFTQGGEVI